MVSYWEIVRRIMANSDSVYKRITNWNEEIIQPINELVINPPEGCGALTELPEAEENHLWMKQDIIDVQNKLKEICHDTIFTDLETPQLITVILIEEIEDAIERGWCDCGPLASYTNNWINGWPFYEGMSNPIKVTYFPTNRDTLNDCIETTWRTSTADGWKRFDSLPYEMIDDSENYQNAVEIKRTYNEIEGLIPIWEENRSLAKYWDYQAGIVETDEEREIAEEKRDEYQKKADEKLLEIDNLALTNIEKCWALTGTTKHTPNLAYLLYEKRDIAKAWDYGNLFAIIIAPWDTDKHPSTHTQSTFEVKVKHSDEDERYVRFEGKCTPSGLPYILADSVGYEFEKLILYAAGDHLWSAISYHYRDGDGLGPCGWMTPPYFEPTEEDVVISDIYLEVTFGVIN